MPWTRDQMAARAAAELSDLAVLDITDGTFTVVELAPSVTVTELQEATAAPVALT